ncbi:hypothetical protein Tco_0951202 [Tanacetum coccineum]|uniref:Uncharacterized protein n=1 Tax=Tanacetum coccineum TaxID=301880 RepID=A0ABQ5DU58_9ASTR
MNSRSKRGKGVFGEMPSRMMVTPIFLETTKISRWLQMRISSISINGIGIVCKKADVDINKSRVCIRHNGTQKQITAAFQAIASNNQLAHLADTGLRSYTCIFSDCRTLYVNRYAAAYAARSTTAHQQHGSYKEDGDRSGRDLETNDSSLHCFTLQGRQLLVRLLCDLPSMPSVPRNSRNLTMHLKKELDQNRVMDVPPSPDRVFDFPMAEPEPHIAYDFFAAEPIPGLVEAPGNMNGWIEEDVPLLGEMGVPMEIAGGAEQAELDLLFGDDTDDDNDGPSATILGTLFHTEQPFPDMTHGTSMPPSVIGDFSVRMGNLEYGHGALVKKMGTVSDAQVVSRLEEIETKVQQVESRVDTHPSGHMALQGQDVIVGLSQQVQTLQTSLHGAELQNQQLRTRLAEMENRESTLMSYMLWMEERLAVLEKKLLGTPPGPQ